MSELSSKLRVALASKLASGRRQLIGKRVKALLVDVDGALIAVSPADFGVGRHLAASGVHDNHVLRAALELVDGKSNVLNVGAHVGTMAIPLSSRVAKVVCIEANPQTRELLEVGIRVNQLQNISVLAWAAWDCTTTLEFLPAESNSGGSKVAQGSLDSRDLRNEAKPVVVDARRLDDVVDEEFDLIIMDIEGSEYRALDGMKNLLANAQALIVEADVRSVEAIGGTTVDEFVARAMESFSSATILSDSPRVAETSVTAIANQIRALGHCDVLFQKG